ncbi:MAG: pilus assembly protein PilP [Zoogloeaceae bacterium]|nr:pilus assembly protein PilP [Zoogloeaceae bacterium]
MMFANRIHLSRLLGKCLVAFLMFCAVDASAAEQRILEKYELDEMELAGLRWNTNDDVWEACFRVPHGFYATTQFVNARIGKHSAKIKEINASSVIIKQSHKNERGAWIKKEITLNPSQEHQCDWDYSIPDISHPGVVWNDTIFEGCFLRTSISSRYELKDMVLSGTRKKNKKWQACFKTPSGFYLIMSEKDDIGSGSAIIAKIAPTHVYVKEIIESQNEVWEERIVTINSPENASCDWKYSILNQAVDYPLHETEDEPEPSSDAQIPSNDTTDRQNLNTSP